MSRRLPLIVLSLLTACAYQSPTAPTPPPATAAEARTPTQMIVKVVGPTGWWPDRIVINAQVLDQRGVHLPGIVACDTSRGYLEPRQWDTASHSGVTWFETAPGAAFRCRSLARPEVAADYTTTAADFQMPRGCCGPGQPTPAPKPPVVPVPDSDSGGA